MKTNEELRKDVMAEIRWDPELRNIATEIGVASNDGLVTLSGVLDSHWKKNAAQKAAQRVLGVKEVACDIEVKVDSIGQRTDREIAEAVRNALRRNSAINEDQIEVKVHNGWVYLSIDFESKKQYARECVEGFLSACYS